jgi:hypothetical protein
MAITDHRIFHYSLAEGWKPIDDPLKSLETDDLEDSRRLGGYSSSFSIGHDQGVSAHLLLAEGTQSPYPYLIDFYDPGYVWQVFVSDFPSVLELMHKFATICQATIVHEVYEETEATRMDEAEKTLDRQREQRRRNQAREQRDSRQFQAPP